MLYGSNKVERLFSSFRLHYKWTVFRGSPVSFYYITASLRLQQEGSRRVHAPQILVAAALHLGMHMDRELTCTVTTV